MTSDKPQARPTYHHGNLRAAVLAATLELVDEVGIENVSIREVSRRAGVSPGAPFRHFKSKTDLMTAVAEEAIEIFYKEINIELKRLEENTPIARFGAIGHAYLRWAVRHPTHFQVISAQSQIDLDGSAVLKQRNEELRRLMDGIPEEIQFGGRSFVFGLARMYISGHFPQWGLSKKRALQSLGKNLDMFIAGVAQELQARPGTPNGGASS